MPNAGERPDLAEFFAGGVEPADIAPLYPLLGARGLIAACIAVFRGGEAEVMVRLLVLREIGARAENLILVTNNEPPDGRKDGLQLLDRATIQV